MSVMRQQRTLQRQQGAVLIVGLVMLLILTILGLAGSRNTTLEERMSGNYRDRTLALQAAEAALRAGEAELADATAFAAMAFDGSDGTYDGIPSQDPFDDSLYDLSLTELNAELADEGHPELSEDPVYYIERLGEFDAPQSSQVVGTGGPPPPKMRFYRVTGKGTGLSETAVVILQSSYFTL